MPTGRVPDATAPRHPVGHSLGAAAVVNALSAQASKLKIVLLAPALRLAAILQRNLNDRGIPRAVYRGMMGKLEKKYGYSLTKNDPHLLIPRLAAKTLLIHDCEDRAIPYQDSRYLTDRHANIHLQTTVGLGHNKLLYDPEVMVSVLEHLFQETLDKESSAWQRTTLQERRTSPLIHSAVANG